MANVIDGQNPIKCDTAGVLKPAGLIHPKAILWTDVDGNEIQDDEDILLSDSEGMEVIGKRASAAGDGLQFTFPEDYFCDGLTMTTIDGGVAYIYI